MLTDLIVNFYISSIMKNGMLYCEILRSSMLYKYDR